MFPGLFSPLASWASPAQPKLLLLELPDRLLEAVGKHGVEREPGSKWLVSVEERVARVTA